MPKAARKASIPASLEPMEARLAVLASSVRELEHKLAGHLQGQAGADLDLYLGHTKRAEGAPRGMSTQDMQSMTGARIRQGELGRLLEMWVIGFSVNWDELHGARRPRCISLPTYPFARERYWLPEADIQAARSPLATQRVRGLLHENTSTLSAQSYRTERSARTSYSMRLE